jgi:hypothetical protein
MARDTADGGSFRNGTAVSEYWENKDWEVRRKEKKKVTNTENLFKTDNFIIQFLNF